GGETQKARGGGLAKGAAGLQKGAADLQKGQQHLAHMLASLTIPRVAASRLEHLAVLARTWVKLGKHSDEVLGKTSNAGLPGAGGKQRAGEAGDHPGGVAPWDALRQELAGLAAGAGLAPPDGAARAVTVGGVEGAGREEDMALEARIAEAMRSYGSSASNLYARASSSWPHLDASWLAHVPPETRNPEPETRNPKPPTLHPQPSTPNPAPSIPDPAPSTPNPAPSTLNPAPCTLHPQPC
ncbi:hypothetical protein T484DRAFT_2153235, partial [Baffinella frigidus]